MQTCTPPTGVIISEFRLRGPNGVNDEFVELYNNTNTALTICTADGSSGWAIASSDGTVRFVVPSNTTIPGRAHYLAAGSSYSLTGYAGSDLAYASDIPDNVGIALFNTANPSNFTMANRLDAVGFTSDTNALYREGAGLTPIGTGNVEYTFRRSLGGTPADTNNNSADFQYLSIDGQFGAKLGAPGPENLGSPIQRNAYMPLSLLDTTVASSVTPNRVRDLTPNPANNSTYGTLSMRRRIVNNTGVHVTRLRFRVTTVTTYPVPSGTADLRALTSTAFVTMNVNDANTCAATGMPATPPCTVTVQGTTLEQPPNQPFGGGYNSTLSVALPQLLAPGASLNLQIVAGVQQTGSFQFFINVEASTDTASPRLDPVNQTGGEGEDPLSRNYNWNVPLVGLPGRAGLDLGLSLAYNSLVWTKSGSFMSFDDDRGFPSPGFRLGFPVIQPLHYNAQAAKNAFMLITPNGERVELRQVGTSPLYEAADSSYLLLDTSTMTLRTTNGTQLSYTWMGSDFQCTQIKDRNGNFITINYTQFGRIDTVVDTLNRTIKFNYDSDYLSSITQVWTVNGAPQTHTWASFAYRNPNLTLQTNFPGLTNVGPQNGSTLKVLSQVTLNDGSRFNFDYTSWGQVWKISNFAADGNLLNYRSYNLPLDSNTAQTDCPRFTERRDWAENWNKNQSGIEQEVVTQFAVPAGASWTMPDGTPQTGTLAQVTLPDGTYHKVYSHASGWDKGLTLLSETYDSGQVRQRQSATTWIQDNTALTFPDNPRVTETNVYDPAGNRARTRVTYQAVSLPDGTGCKLPQDLFEYQANATTVLRRTHTDYNLATAYTSRRIIGLVSEKTLHQVDPSTQVETLMSKVGFQYDETGSIQGNDAPVQHDNTNYTSGFVAGRATLSSVKRYDVLNTSLFVSSSRKYNTAGAVVQTTDPANHQVTISYADAFAANGTTLDAPRSFTTLAYPTTVTDADGYTSSSRYHYDFGAATWEQTPQPNTLANLPGPEQKLTYDSLGRIERITNLVNNAYTRFIYGPNYVESFGSVNNIADEAHALQVFDGAGRAIAKAGNHPGSQGGFSGQLVHYDVMGRVIRQSNPTETSISVSGVPIFPYGWQATGDDVQAGWIYTQQTYDWKGRPLVTTNTDSTTKEASYGGCGCAGGEVVTLTAEGTIVSGVTKKRQQKTYSDVLGRTVKTEVFNWDGAGPFGTGGSVYSATVNAYNARDQITTVKQYVGVATSDGSCPSGTCQETATIYDGHGRLKTSHLPEQNAGTNTVWDYNSDDTIQKITDARGASQTLSYNNRHFATGVVYNAPTGITIPPAVSFDYDAAGNRMTMVDGMGSTTYQYNQLSQMTSETRQFTGLAGSYTLSYDYTLAGTLKSITDHTNQRINYGYDNVGRLNNLTGTNYSITQFINSVAYRGWGAPKQVAYGNGRTLSLGYNSRLQASRFEILGAGGFPSAMSIDYQYYNDGRLSYSHDLLDAKFDRAQRYDHVARITDGLSGAEARGEPPTNDRPYKQTNSYDAFNHLTVRSTRHWSRGLPYASSDSYVDDRRSGWQYDADGNLTNNIKRQYTYDAAGQMIAISGGNLNQFFDGEGRRVKTTDAFLITYYLRSSVLGGEVIEELDASGNKQRGFVYVGGKVVALEGQNGFVGFVHEDASGMSIRETHSVAANVYQRYELDALGTEAEIDDPYIDNPSYSGRGEGGPVYPGYGNITQTSTGCTLDGVLTHCDLISQGLENGSIEVEYMIWGERNPGGPS
jgi:YD repeat-containing protein